MSKLWNINQYKPYFISQFSKVELGLKFTFKIIAYFNKVY